MRKDQQLAFWAYEKTSKAKREGVLDDYEIAVQNFAAVLLRSGLEVAVSVLERERDRKGFAALLQHLAEKNTARTGSERNPGAVAGGSRAGSGARPQGGGQSAASTVEPKEWAHDLRANTDVSAYMLMTREIRAQVTWLRRACRALNAERQPVQQGGPDARPVQ